MWKRKELKTKAKQVVKRNYWTAMIVCFLVVLLTGEFGTSIVGLLQSDDSVEPHYIIHNESIFMNEQMDEEKAQELKEKSEKIEEKKSMFTETQIKLWEALEANLNSATKSQKYIFKIWDAIEAIHINQMGLGILLFAAACIAFLYTILFADPLIVAGRKYFLKARQDENTKMGVMKEIFKRGNWSNVATTMFLRNVYNFLWYLTIIGGVIKTYEYRMIPYILAENPKIERKQAFKLSKQMMKGNKWRTFLLDMSFFFWSLLSVLTFGLLNIFYVNPYRTATVTELYVTLRKKAKEEKYEYFEELNDEIIK